MYFIFCQSWFRIIFQCNRSILPSSFSFINLFLVHRYVLHKISSKKTDHWFPNVTIPRSANKYSEKYLSRIPKSLVRKVELGYDLDFELFGFNSILSEEPGDKS